MNFLLMFTLCFVQFLDTRQPKKKFDRQLAEFVFAGNDVDRIWFSGSSVNPSMLNDTICSSFGAIQKSAIHVTRKSVIYETVKGEQKYEAGMHAYVHCSCLTEFRLTWFKRDIAKGKDLKIKVAGRQIEKCNCSQSPLTFRQIRGEARKK
jgi:hypothetical protein